MRTKAFFFQTTLLFFSFCTPLCTHDNSLDNVGQGTLIVISEGSQNYIYFHEKEFCDGVPVEGNGEDFVANVTRHVTQKCSQLRPALPEGSTLNVAVNTVQFIKTIDASGRESYTFVDGSSLQTKEVLASDDCVVRDHFILRSENSVLNQTWKFLEHASVEHKDQDSSAIDKPIYSEEQSQTQKPFWAPAQTSKPKKSSEQRLFENHQKALDAHHDFVKSAKRRARKAYLEYLASFPKNLAQFCQKHELQWDTYENAIKAYNDLTTKPGLFEEAKETLTKDGRRRLTDFLCRVAKEGKYVLAWRDKGDAELKRLEQQQNVVSDLATAVTQQLLEIKPPVANEPNNEPISEKQEAWLRSVLKEGGLRKKHILTSHRRIARIRKGFEACIGKKNLQWSVYRFYRDNLGAMKRQCLEHRGVVSKRLVDRMEAFAKMHNNKTAKSMRTYTPNSHAQKLASSLFTKLQSCHGNPVQQNVHGEVVEFVNKRLVFCVTNSTHGRR